MLPGRDGASQNGSGGNLPPLRAQRNEVILLSMQLLVLLLVLLLCQVTLMLVLLLVLALLPGSKATISKMPWIVATGVTFLLRRPVQSRKRMASQIARPSP